METTLQSISLPAKNARGLRDFYVQAFGLKENEKRSHPPGFFMIEGGKGCNLLIMDAEGSETKAGNIGFELGMEVSSLDQLVEKVIAAGGRLIKNTQQMKWGTALLLEDPEGHSINAYMFNK